MMTGNTTSIKTKIKFFPFYAISLLPMWILYRISDITFLLLFRVLKYRRKVVHKNLLQSFPQKSESEIRRIEKSYYKHLSDVLFEAIKRLTISKDEVKKRLILHNPEIVGEFIEKGRSVLFYCGHQGNWEWLTFVPLFLPYKAYTFFRPLKNAYFNEFFRIIRERHGVRCVEERKGYITLLRNHQSNTLAMYCLIGDQSPTRRSARHWCQFLNRETAFYTGAEKIAQQMNPVVIFPAFDKIKRGHYILKFEILEDRPAAVKDSEIVERYAEMLEHSISKSPDMWLWSHRRWKLKRAS